MVLRAFVGKLCVHELAVELTIEALKLARTFRGPGARVRGDQLVAAALSIGSNIAPKPAAAAPSPNSDASYYTPGDRPRKRLASCGSRRRPTRRTETPSGHWKAGRSSSAR